jgi:hypothetical protein
VDGGMANIHRWSQLATADLAAAGRLVCLMFRRAAKLW